MDFQDFSTQNRLVPWLLVIVNILGIGVGYAISIILARSLSLHQFEQYIGTIATLGLLGTLAEAGFGKYALKIVPIYQAHRSFGLMKGYLRFAGWGCLILSIALGLLAAAIEVPLRAGAGREVMLIALICLPCIAGAGVAIDMLLAFRLATTATVLARILVPLTTLGLILLVLSISEINPYRAVLCFSIGSMLGLVMAVAICARLTGGMLTGVNAELQSREWFVQGFSFLAFGFMTSWLFKATLVLLHHLPHPSDELALLAPAFETGCLILLLSKSTDKYFQPTMAIIIDGADWAQGVSLRNQRFAVLSGGICLFLLIVFCLGKQILRIYGEEFVGAYPALCLIALGSSLWTLFSLAPAFLLFAGQKRALLLSLLGHGIALAILTIGLFRVYGITGAAAAYMLAIGSLALVNFQLANRTLARMRLVPAKPPADAALENR